jgi:hypothetical protein
MHHKGNATLIAIFIVLGALLAPGLAGAPVQFTVDPSQSAVSLSGGILGNPLQEQGPGSLVTHFYGPILAEVGTSSIRFTGGSTVAAQTNGVWQPGVQGAAGSAPADYAAKASSFIGSVKGALRNVLLDVTSAALPLTNGQFDASGLLFAFPTNSTSSFDYDAGALLGAGGVTLSGVSTNKIGSTGTITTVGSTMTLTIHIDTQFKFKALIENDSSVHLTGVLVATHVDQPEITGFGISGPNVVIYVQGAGATPRLDSSPDLATWTTQNPTVTPGAGGVILTLPMSGPLQFYRVAK